MICEICKLRKGSYYELDGKEMAICFPCVQRLIEERGWKDRPIPPKIDPEIEESRKEIEYKEKHDPFRNIERQAKEWIKKYLELSGIQRNQYNQIVDKYKRLSMSQIRGILREIHGYNVTEETIGKFKAHLIREGLLKTDREFEGERPSEKELQEIRQKGARSQAIELSKRKEHLDLEEIEPIQDRFKELGEKQERGLCLNCEEEKEIEDYEDQKED